MNDDDVLKDVEFTISIKMIGQLLKSCDHIDIHSWLLAIAKGIIVCFQ